MIFSAISIHVRLCQIQLQSKMRVQKQSLQQTYILFSGWIPANQPKLAALQGNTFQYHTCNHLHSLPQSLALHLLSVLSSLFSFLPTVRFPFSSPRLLFKSQNILLYSTGHWSNVFFQVYNGIVSYIYLFPFQHPVLTYSYVWLT